jgi:OmpA-OmpF porin, OOP family
MRSRIALLVLLIAAWATAAAAEDPAETAPTTPTGEAEDCVGKARLRGLVFADGGSEIEKPDQAVLDLVAEAIKTRCAGKTITIEGHTSVSGSPESNQQLSERRAQAVERYLIERGVPASQLRAVGYGESRPITTDASPEAQKVNRRVTLVAN